MTIGDITVLFYRFSEGIFLAKAFLLTFIFFYGILALVIVRQVQLMAEILDESNFSPFLKFFSSAHLIASIIVFVLALILFMF